MPPLPTPLDAELRICDATLNLVLCYVKTILHSAYIHTHGAQHSTGIFWKSRPPLAVHASGRGNGKLNQEPIRESFYWFRKDLDKDILRLLFAVTDIDSSIISKCDLGVKVKC